MTGTEYDVYQARPQVDSGLRVIHCKIFKGIKQREAMTGDHLLLTRQGLLPSHRMSMRGDMLHQENDWKGTAKVELMSDNQQAATVP